MTEQVKLGEICHITLGQSPNSSFYNSTGQGLPFFQGNADFGVLHPVPSVWCTVPRKTADNGDLLLSVRAPIGAVNIANSACCIGRGIAALRPKDDRLITEYLRYCLLYKNKELAKQGTGSTFTAVGKRILQNFLIPIPDTMTQNLIVNHLNGIEQLQCIAKDMLSKYDELIQSRFVEMFTPFEGNSIMVPLDEVGDIQTGATPSRENADYYQGEIPWVKTGEVQYGIICKTGENITEQALRDTNCKLFPAGTVVVAMYGQGDTRGKAAILGVEAATNQACAAIILDRSICNPTFLLTQLKLRYEDLRGKSVGATQKNLSLKIIREFPILLPPLPLQQQFAAFAEQINRMKEKAAKTLEQLQTLYDSLAQEYFAG